MHDFLIKITEIINDDQIIKFLNLYKNTNQKDYYYLFLTELNYKFEDFIKTLKSENYMNTIIFFDKSIYYKFEIDFFNQRYRFFAPEHQLLSYHSGYTFDIASEYEFILNSTHVWSEFISNKNRKIFSIKHDKYGIIVITFENIICEKTCLFIDDNISSGFIINNINFKEFYSIDGKKKFKCEKEQNGIVIPFDENGNKLNGYFYFKENHRKIVFQLV